MFSWCYVLFFFFFFNDTATTEIYTLSLHDALPIFASLAVIPPSPSAVYLIFAVIGLSGSAATAMPYAVAIRNLFDSERGVALGLVNFGSGIGSAVAPYCASVLAASSFGWRSGYLGVGLVGLAPVAGLLFLVR